jgi:hypothetical protein
MKRWAASQLRRFAAWMLVAVALSPFAFACREPQPNETPEGAVRALVEHLRQLDGSNDEAEKALELLSAETKANLQLRADRYSAASGKHIPAFRMLAPASFREAFEAEKMEAEVRGNQALVRVHGLIEQDEALIQCVFEEGGWRVHVPLPALPPVVVRTRDEKRPNRGK